MSEQEKTLGQIFKEAWRGSYESNHDRFEIGAQAVAARVREECALRLEAVAKRANEDGRKPVVSEVLGTAAFIVRDMNEASHE